MRYDHSMILGYYVILDGENCLCVDTQPRNLKNVINKPSVLSVPYGFGEIIASEDVTLTFRYSETSVNAAGSDDKKNFQLFQIALFADPQLSVHSRGEPRKNVTNFLFIDCPNSQINRFSVGAQLPFDTQWMK